MRNTTITEEDIFNSLFEIPSRFKQTGCPRKGSAISAEGVTVGIGLCPVSEWILIAAAVVNDNMVMCRRSHTTGEVSYVLLRSRRTTQVPSSGRGTIIVPSFVGAQQLQILVANSGSDLFRRERGRTRTMDHKSVFALIQSKSRPSLQQHSTVTPELFGCLFGLESQLSTNPVLLIGCQNGVIYFTNFRSGNSSGIRAKDAHPNLMCPLYSLEQPIVGIHTTYFPRNELSAIKDPFLVLEEEEVHEHHSETHNAIIFLGLSGKIAICHASSDKQPCPRFIEFHVPSPVLSSVLVPKHSLLYSSLQGLYRICLKQECFSSVEEKFPNLNSKQFLRIPETSFKFPEKVFDSNHDGSYLLHGKTGGQPSVVPAESAEKRVHCLCLSLEGRLSTFVFKSHDTQGSSRKRSSKHVGREIKQCLQTIQTQSEKVEQLMGKIQSMNSIFSGLKSVLEVLNSVGTAKAPTKSSSSPFTCSFKSTCEEVGVCVEKLCMMVQLTYTRIGSTLGDGWSFLVISLRGNCVTSKSVPITGMVSGSSVTVRMDMNTHTMSAVYPNGSLLAYIHHNPSHFLQWLPIHNNSTPTKSSANLKGACLFLARKDFDILDFLQARKHLTKESLSNHQLRTVKSILSPDLVKPPLIPNSSLPHNFKFSVLLTTVIRIVQAASSISIEELRKMNTETVGTKLLGVLVPGSASSNPVAKGGLSAPEVWMALNRERAHFKLSSAVESRGAEVLVLDIRASSRDVLVEVIGAVYRTLRNGVKQGPVTDPGSREELCRRLQELKELLWDLAHTQREFSTAYQEMKTNCTTLESYYTSLQSCKSKTFSIYYRLRKSFLCT